MWKIPQEKKEEICLWFHFVLATFAAMAFGLLFISVPLGVMTFFAALGHELALKLVGG